MQAGNSYSPIMAWRKDKLGSFSIHGVFCSDPVKQANKSREERKERGRGRREGGNQGGNQVF